MKTIFVLLVISLFCVGLRAEYPELCRLFKDGTLLRKPGSCSEYLVCQDGDGTTKSCASGKLYDRKKQTCADAADITGDTYCDNPCDGVKVKWAANKSYCPGYYYCESNPPQAGSCEPGYHFSQDKQMCVFATDSACVANVVTNICDLAADNADYRDETTCSSYYKCTSGKPKSTNCDKKSYYNVKSGKCEEKSLVECDSVPGGSCGKATGSPFVGFKTDSATCRGFFYCRNMGSVKDMEPVWGQCPVGLFFDSTSQSCVDPIEAVCDYNRCQGRPNMMVQTSTNNCRNFIVCENGVATKEVKCRDDMFFDEKLQACVKNIISYPCCDGTKNEK